MQVMKTVIMTRGLNAGVPIIVAHTFVFDENNYFFMRNKLISIKRRIVLYFFPFSVR